MPERYRQLRRLAPLVAAIAIACATAALTVPGTASALVYGHTYCNQWMVTNQTCPPYGSSEWHHLLENAAEARRGSLCIDEYLDPSGSGYYTGASCVSQGHTAAQYPGATWGYPRSWETSGEGYIFAIEEWEY